MKKPRARVLVFPDLGGGWRYRAVAPNGRKLFVSEAYTRSRDAMRAARDLVRGLGLRVELVAAKAKARARR